MSMSQTTPSSRRYRTTRDLTIAQRWLVKTMSENHFGRVENLRIAGGEPVPDRNMKVVRIARLGTNGGDVPIPAETGDFELKQATRDLFEEFSRIGNGVVRRLEFRYGLPFQIETTATADDDVIPESKVV